MTELTRAQLDELERLARRGADEAKEFHFERSAQVGVSPFTLLALIALVREGLAAREAIHLHCENGCQKVVFERRCINCGGLAVNVPDCECRPTPERHAQ